MISIKFNLFLFFTFITLFFGFTRGNNLHYHEQLVLKHTESNHTQNDGFAFEVTANEPADDACIYMHNAIRITHAVAALTFSPTLKTLAKRCANYHANMGTTENKAGPEPQCPYITNPGPNELLGFHDLTKLGVVGASQIMRGVIWAWYVEEGLNYGAPIYGPLYRHKSQLIWKGTTQFACAVSDIHSTATMFFYVSCLYSPAGNDPPTFAQNISPPVV